MQIVAQLTLLISLAPNIIMDDCVICGAPTEVIKEYLMNIFDFWGDSPILFQKVRCAAGHSYDREVTWED